LINVYQRKVNNICLYFQNGVDHGANIAKNHEVEIPVGGIPKIPIFEGIC
jgi:hypothetical protein